MCVTVVYHPEDPEEHKKWDKWVHQEKLMLAHKAGAVVDLDAIEVARLAHACRNVIPAGRRST